MTYCFISYPQRCQQQMVSQSIHELSNRKYQIWKILVRTTKQHSFYGSLEWEREKVKSVVDTGTETGHSTVQSDKLFYSIKIRQAIDRDVGLCKSRTSLFILQIKWSCLLKWTSGGIRQELSIVLERANWPKPEQRGAGAKTLWCLLGRKLNRICNLFGISL